MGHEETSTCTVVRSVGYARMTTSVSLGHGVLLSATEGASAHPGRCSTSIRRKNNRKNKRETGVRRCLATGVFLARVQKNYQYKNWAKLGKMDTPRLEGRRQGRGGAAPTSPGSIS